MSAEAEVSIKNWDGLKWLSVLMLIVAGVVGNQYFSAESLLYRVIALIVVAGITGYIAFTTTKGESFSRLLKDAKVEIRKVVWPTRPELTQTTLIVVVFVLVVGLFLWGLDSLISFIISGIIG